MAAARQWTYEDYCRLPEDGIRYEIIGKYAVGQVVRSEVLPGLKVRVREVFAF